MLFFVAASKVSGICQKNESGLVYESRSFVGQGSSFVSPDTRQLFAVTFAGVYLSLILLTFHFTVMERNSAGLWYFLFTDLMSVFSGIW